MEAWRALVTSPGPAADTVARKACCVLQIFEGDSNKSK